MLRETDIFKDPRSPEGLKVFEIDDCGGETGTVYPDQPSFLADRRRFVVTTGRGRAVCDPDDGGRLRHFGHPEPPAAAPGPAAGAAPAKKRPYQVSIDGRYAYRRSDKAALSIMRLDFETMREEEILFLDGLLPGTDIPAARFSPMTFSADNRRAAGVCRLGDGRTADAPVAIVALDLERAAARPVWSDPCFINTHLRYCLSADPEASHDLLVQMNHGARTDAAGVVTAHLGPPAEGGVDLHVIRDDGTGRRDLPFGRDGRESCIGHQVWRGRDSRAVVAITLQNLDTSYGWADGSNQEIVAGLPAAVAADAPHRGRLTPGARRVTLSRGFPDPRFNHLSCDETGRRFAFDTFPLFDGARAGMCLYTGTARGEDEPLEFRYILNSGVTLNRSNGYHAHPVMAPDGGFLLFKSRVSGQPRGYLVTGFAS